MIIFLLVSECGEGKSISSEHSPWICQQGRFTPPPPSLAGVILELDGAPFKREVKYVVFFIAGTMRRSDYRREKCPPTEGIR